MVANGVEPAVASLSVAGSPSRSLDQAVRNLIKAGIAAVVAAGGGNTDACAVSPARVTEVSLYFVYLLVINLILLTYSHAQI